MPAHTSTHRLPPILRDLLAQILIAIAVGLAASVTLASAVVLLAYFAQPPAAEVPVVLKPAELRT